MPSTHFKPTTRNTQHKYYLIYKPYGMLSQFSKEGDKLTLADLPFSFAKDVYPVGRLDADSEGLLLLTNDKSLNDALLNPKHAHQRTYWAQVEGTITPQAIAELQKGVTITVDGTPYKTLPAKAMHLENEPNLPPRNPPIRFRASIPTSWVELTLVEGKNRQVRKMCAKVGFPVLRLVRAQMGNLRVGDMQPSEVLEITRESL